MNKVASKIKLHRQELLIFSTFGLLTLIATYPIIFRMGTSVYGPLYRTDNISTVWHFWWLKYAWLHRLPSKFVSIIATPFGVHYSSQVPYYPVWMFLSKWSSILTNEVFTYNLTILVSFLLSAIFMYYLVYYFTKNKLASITSGIIYAFCPYHFNRAWEHLGLANIQWMPLYVLALLRLNDKRTYKNAILCGIAFWLVISFDYYYAYIMSIFTLGFLLFCFGYRWRRKWHLAFNGQWSRLKQDIKPAVRTLKMVVVAILFGVIVASPALYPIFKAMLFAPKTEAVAAAGYVRPFKELFSYSARPLSYLLPSKEHPLFGRGIEPFIGSIFYGRGTIEHTLYLGYIPLLLTFVAYRRWRRRRKETRDQPALAGTNYQSKEDFMVGFFIFSCLVALVFSMPPYLRIGNFKLFFPSFFMYKVLPMFRCYARFGAVVMLAVSVLAGFGLKYILEKIKTSKKRFALTTLITCLILFEFTNIPPFHTTDVSYSSQVYQWLSDQPGDFAVAEYPFGQVSIHKDYLFYQRVHQKRLINGAWQGTYAFKVRQKIVNILDPQTPGILSYLGAKYVLVHLDKYLDAREGQGVDIIGEVPDLSRQLGLKLLKKFDNVEVYKVKAKPIEPQVE